MEKNLSKTLGANIASRRSRLGLTQAQLAELLDIGQDALSRMEKGVISPKISRLPILASSLRCSVAELFRTPDDTSSARAAAIEEIIGVLPSEQQEHVLKIMSEIVNTLVDKN